MYDTKEEQTVILDWLYDIIGDFYVMCNVYYIIIDTAQRIPCSKCRLIKTDGHYQLKLVLPENTLLIDQEDFTYVVAETVHFPDEEDSIFIFYRDGFDKYRINIVPVRRVPISDKIKQISEHWNHGIICE